MTERITALTPTGARPEAFAACVEHMRAQTVAAKWIIVDDGPEPLPTPEIDGWDVMHIWRTPCWQPGQNTLAANLLCGLGAMPRGARVAVVEDDDQYAPWWLQVCDERLDQANLVGESHSLYRHRVSGRGRDMGNDTHASLCSTALKGPALATLRWACEAGAKGIDVRLWRAFDGPKRLYRPEPRGVTGIKGWPGRPGIGVGHRL